ncbi:MAG: 1-phosphofructokinase family hexose kinase [Mycobacteriales bacterium]
MTALVTVTPNPSVDRTLHVQRLVPGVLNRATSPPCIEPSGKGINVALAAHAAGHGATAVFPCGGRTGEELLELLAGTGLPCTAVPISGSVRANISVVGADGETTKINEPGPALSSSEVSALVEASLLPGPGWLAWCGRLPAGFSPADLASAVERARAAGRRVAVDTSGAALAGVLPAQPDLLKPNATELAELTGRPLHTVGDVAAAAEALVRRGVGAVLVSLGADGALLAEAEGVWHGTAPVRRVVNTVGAGDALLAGYLIAAGLHSSAADRLATALRWGATAVAHAGTLVSRPDPAIDVHLHPLDAGRSLTEPII